MLILLTQLKLSACKTMTAACQPHRACLLRTRPLPRLILTLLSLKLLLPVRAPVTAKQQLLSRQVVVLSPAPQTPLARQVTAAFCNQALQVKQALRWMLNQLMRMTPEQRGRSCMISSQAAMMMSLTSQLPSKPLTRICQTSQSQMPVSRAQSFFNQPQKPRPVCPNPKAPMQMAAAP